MSHYLTDKLEFSGERPAAKQFICAHTEHNLPPNFCEDFGLFSEQSGEKSADRRQRESFEQNAELNGAFVKKT